MKRRSAARVLAAVLFTDIVDSSTLAGRMGDRRWKEVIARHHAIVRRALKRHGGRELDTAGDGFFASFGEPAGAIRCACAIADAVRSLGLEIRAGIHFGECEQVGGKLAGVSVVVGARVSALGDAGDVLVTGTTRELVGGAGFGFEDHGRHALKGVDGEWQVFAVTHVDGDPRPAPLPTDEARSRLGAVQPSGVFRPSSRLTASVVVATAIVATAIALIASRDDAPRALDRIRPDRVGRIDPATSEIRETVNVGSDPTGIAIGDDAAWVLRLEPGIVARVALATGAIETVSTGGHPSAIALDRGGLVWVLNGLEATVVGIERRRLTIDERIELPTGTKDLAVGEGALWVTNADERTLARIDLVTGDVSLADLSDIGSVNGVAVTPSGVWVGGSTDIVKLNHASLQLIDTWPLRFPAGQLAADRGSVWVTHLADDQVTKVDEETGPSAVLEVGDGPIDVAAGAGAVWVTNALDGSVSRIDTATHAVESIHVGSSPEGIAVGEGSVWVAVHEL